MSKARDLADVIGGNFALPVGALANAPNPIQAGTIAYLGMSTAPSGWLKANGAAVSRTTYADLFAAIGTTFGSGDGSTTFNLPDLRGEFPRGLDDGRGVDSGRTIGSSQAEDFKAHGHSVTINSVSAATGYGGGASNYNVGSQYAGPTAAGGTHTHSASIGNSGGTETRPRNVALLACIKY